MTLTEAIAKLTGVRRIAYDSHRQLRDGTKPDQGTDEPYLRGRIFAFDEALAALEAVESETPEGLRDKFAMAALTGLKRNSNFIEETEESMAHYAYEQADAMLLERGKGR